MRPQRSARFIVLTGLSGSGKSQAIRALDSQGMVAILGYFYFGQDERLANETAVKNATTNATKWVLDQGYKNVLIEIDNECDSPDYNYAILTPTRVSELITAVQTQSANYGRRLYVAVSFSGGSPSTGGALSTWTIGFTSGAAGNLSSGSTITVVFDAAFGVPANRGQMSPVCSFRASIEPRSR